MSPTSSSVPADAVVPAPHATPGGVGRRRCQRAGRRALAWVGAVAVTLAPLAACGSEQATTEPRAVEATVTPSVPQGLDAYYAQEPDWQACGSGDSVKPVEGGAYECATIDVPLDYANPQGQTISVAMKRLRATGERIGTLVVNPGGPGGSGVELVDSVKGYFSDELLASYDVVGFDPRGVGASTAVDCYSDSELDEERAGAEAASVDEASADEARAQVRQQAEDFAAACEARTEIDGLLDHIDTVSAARDLDVMRAALGESTLTYLGYSYGTYLGATYADLFPTSVGRMVLDGAIDPALSGAQVALGQAKGFESALRAFVADCQEGSGCPLTGDVDQGVSQVREFLTRTQDQPVPTSDPDRPLTYSLAVSAIIGVLYQDESWSVLSEGLNQAMLQNDGSTLLYVADVFASRNSDGTYSGNGDEVINAVNCLDYPVEGDAAQWDEQAAALREASPTFGEELTYGDEFCQAWGHASTREHTAITAEDAAPILVVGTTGDPATPYEWSQALASQLAHATLLTWEGQGHTAYGRAGSCVTTAVDAYLLSGTMPEEGTVCRGQE